MRPSGYVNLLTEPVFLALKHGIEYIMHHTHEPIMYFIELKRALTNITSKAEYAEIRKNNEYSNLLFTYFDADHARGISEIISVTSTVHLFNGTIVY